MIQRNLETQINSLSDLTKMITTYEEIASGRIKQNRESVLRTRNFMSEINQLFFEVISSYKGDVEALMKIQHALHFADFSFMNKNGKTLYILISANTGLYGSLTRRTFELFLNGVKGKTVDIAIIGRLGQALWQNEKLPSNYKYFDFSDQSFNKDLLKEILDYIIPYSKVVVYYGRFQNLVDQEVTSSDVSGTTQPTQRDTTNEIKYYFEPSLAKILEFFEKQIFSSIFEQVVRESQLAKISSRLNTLNSASENISRKLGIFVLERDRNYHQHQNKKQLQTFSSRMLWGQNQ